MFSPNNIFQDGARTRCWGSQTYDSEGLGGVRKFYKYLEENDIEEKIQYITNIVKWADT